VRGQEIEKEDRGGGEDEGGTLTIFIKPRKEFLIEMRGGQMKENASRQHLRTLYKETCATGGKEVG